MDIWIRNQNKMNLVKCDTFIIATNKTHHLNTADNLYHIISIINSAGYADLGAYKTKERALELLDEIQNRIKDMDKRDFLGMQRANYISNVYQMPKE